MSSDSADDGRTACMKTDRNADFWQCAHAHSSNWPL